jgi:hypothetical protein
MKQNKKTSRREFIATTGLATAGLALGASGVKASVHNRASGPANRIRMGFIGIGNRGSQIMHHFMNQPDCEVAALCDVYEPFMSRNGSDVHPRYIKRDGRTDT